MFFSYFAVILGSLSASVSGTDIETRASDPCAAIAQTWANPSAVRACYTSFAVNETIKSNIIEVITKTLAFHTSVNYEFKAPEPFTSSVHEDVLGDLARISKQEYPSEYDLHIDLSRTLKRLQDGHCVWINACYDSVFVNFLPTPLVLLTDSSGSQNIHIAPEAFEVASAEFGDEIEVWQNALPRSLKGQLSTLSGAKVLLINGQDPWVAVDANALITGSFQGLGTRQNSFFSSYSRSLIWAYIMGDFAQQSLPLSDNATLTIQRVNSSKIDVITLPYRSRFSTTAKNFTDSASFRRNNCLPVSGTNGVDVYAASSAGLSSEAISAPPIARYQQQPKVKVSRKQPMNVMLDTSPLSDVVLPPVLQPSSSPLNGSFESAQFYLLNDSITGVLALGSFSTSDFNTFMDGLVVGLLSLRELGAQQLVVDVSNNGGGFICIAHWLHRIIIGPKNTTVPQAGLPTKARAGPLAQEIVKQIVTANADPDNELLYNPLEWTDANNQPFPADDDWLQPPVNVIINGRKDAFSQKLGQECQPFATTPPDVALFDPKKVVIVSNGRCASSCSLFSVTMAKEEGVRTVVVGGKKDVQQQFCGTVGGQSTDFSTMDTEVKTTHLKNSTLAPPDLLVSGVQGITWRLGFGVEDPTQPEEWQTRPADLNLPLTAANVNNPVAIWESVVEKLLA